jgi:streptogramin lyase
MVRERTGLCLVLLLAGLALLAVSAARAAPIGVLKQFRVPTANTSPKSITQGSDGNFWFTEGNVNPPMQNNQNVSRITPAGDITEFFVCVSCFPNDIVQGLNGVLYFTKSDPGLGRITTSGQVLPDVAPAGFTTAIGNGMAARGADIFFTDFNNNNIWRFSATSRTFSQFPIPTAGADPFDVAVYGNGIVWFTEFQANRIGRLDPATGVITETVVTGDPRQITIATDGTVWFTERFANAVGHLDPLTSQVTLFPLAAGAGPEGMAAAPDGSVWFTQSAAGNVARITAAGVISEGRVVKGSEPSGVTVAPDGNPWYAELSTNKIAELQLK